MKKMLTVALVGSVLSFSVLADEYIGDITVNNNSGNIGSCIMSGSHGDNYCNVNIETLNGDVNVDASSLTEEQLAKIKGEAGKDGVTTVVNEYNKDQVDADFATDTDVSESYDEMIARTDHNAETSRLAHSVALEVNARSIERDANQDKVITENKVRSESNTSSIETERIQRETTDGVLIEKTTNNSVEIKANTIAHNTYVKAQAKVDSSQDTRMTKAEKELYSTTARSKGNTKRIGALESDVSELQGDVKRLNGAIAMATATATMVVPQSFNGHVSIQFALGTYAGEEALALGIITGTEDIAIRATVSGSSADDWNELAYGASVNFAF